MLPAFLGLVPPTTLVPGKYKRQRVALEKFFFLPSHMVVFRGFLFRTVFDGLPGVETTAWLVSVKFT